jgi:hypothetical protein
LIPFKEMQRLRRFAKYWDLVGNSGNFTATLPLIWHQTKSPFAAFLNFSDWIYGKVGRQHGIALSRIAELLFEFLTDEKGLQGSEIAQSIWSDFTRCGRFEKPGFLAPYVSDEQVRSARQQHFSLKRQSRHLATLAAPNAPPVGGT